MNSAIYAINASISQLRELVADFPGVFPNKDAEQGLQVPPGWLALLRLALEETEAEPREMVRIERLWVENGSLTAVFSAGSAPAQEAFLALLAEARVYCPCCGNFWPARDREKALAD